MNQYYEAGKLRALKTIAEQLEISNQLKAMELNIKLATINADNRKETEQNIDKIIQGKTITKY